MTNLMYCPLTMIDKHGQIHECTSDCAWAVRERYHNIYMCAIAVKYTELTNYGVNARPLKDDTND